MMTVRTWFRLWRLPLQRDILTFPLLMVLPVDDISPISPSTCLDRVRQAVQDLPSKPRAELSGRGIVMCAGGRRLFTNAWVCVRMLREVGCNLPIQLWYLGPSEFSEEMADILAPYNVECVDALGVSDAQGEPLRLRAGWPLKPYAMVHSPFEEVLFLDADNMPLRDPAYLFESQEYLSYGSVFWPDKDRFSRRCEIWKLMGLAYRNEPEFESGQIVLNKRLCWQPLQLALWMNLHADFFYHYVHGDKDTFRLAFHFLGRTFGMIQVPVVELTPVGRHPSSTRAQHDPNGEVLFQHRTYPKWRLFGPNLRVIGFQMEDRCLEFIDQLRESWSAEIDGPAAGRTQ